MRTPIWFLLAGCGSDAGLTRFNASPDAQVTTVPEGAVEGTSVQVAGRVSDADNAADTLRVEWQVGGAIACAAAPPDTTGLSTCTFVAPGDDTLVSMVVTDPQGATGLGQAPLTIVPNAAPTAVIASPSPSAIYYAGTSIPLVGVVADAEDAEESLRVEWESSLDGVLDIGDAAPNASGEVIATTPLTAGEHLITLTALDTFDKPGTDYALITVLPPNTSPMCAITSPDDGALGAAGEWVSFAGQVSDAETEASALVVEWSSSIDGPGVSGSPSSTGATTWSSASLSVGVHTIRLTATDDAGATCTAQRTFTVGDAPEVDAIEPTFGAVVDVGSTLLLHARMTDDAALSTASVRWVSDIDGEIALATPDSSGNAYASVSTLTRGEHLLTVTATDAAGYTATDVTRVRVNGLPTAPAVRIEPATAGGDTPLTVAFDTPSSDPDGDTVSYRYAWFLGAATTPTSTDSTLSPAYTSAGEVWTVRVTPTDGYTTGPFDEANTTIQNAPPNLGTVRITPSSLTTDTDVRCEASASDPDGPTATVAYTWKITRSSVETTVDTGSAVLAASEIVKGDAIVCVATATDAVGATASAESATATVGDAAPEVTALTLTPTDADSTATLTASATLADPDGDATSATFTWSVDGVVALTTTDATAPFTSTLTADRHARGDVVEVVITPRAAGLDGATDTASVAIGNAPPTAPSVQIQPSAPHGGEALTVHLLSPSTDPDLDALTYRYAWYRGAGTTPISTEATLLPSYVGVGDTWRVTVTADDGDRFGPPGEALVTVVNGEPTVDSVALTPDPAQTNDTLSCLTEGTDPEGKPLVWEYVWKVWTGGIPTIVAESDATLSGAFFAVDDEVTCTATASDGVVDSEPLTSEPVLIEDTPPELDSLEVTPGMAYTDTELTATATASDDDGDPVQVTFTWKQGATTLRTETDFTAPFGSTLDGTLFFDKGDTIRVTAVPRAAGADGVPRTHGPIDIQNSPPVLSGVALNPAEPTAQTAIDCVPGAYTDPDDDEVGFAYRWRVGLTYQADTDARLEVGKFRRGNTITCLATPDDGEDDGLPRAAEALVGNALPILISTSITPTAPKTDTTLTANATPSDPDNDLTSYTYRWYVDGVLAKESIFPDNQLSGSYFVRDDEVTVEITVWDQFGAGESETASAVTIQNTAPTAPTVTFAPSYPIAGSTDLRCVAAGTTDLDGDSTSYEFSWTRNGLPWSGGTLTSVLTGDTIDAADLAGDDAWRCRVVARDAATGTTPSAASTASFAQTIVDHNLADASVRITSDQPTSEQRTVFFPVGDATGDGKDDVLLVATTSNRYAPGTGGWQNEFGAAYLIGGHQLTSSTFAVTDALATYYPLACCNFGETVAVLRQRTATQAARVAISANVPDNFGTMGPGLYMFDIGSAGAIDAPSATNASAVWRLDPMASWSGFGWTTVPDGNNLWVGAPWAYAGSGAVYLINGNTTGTKEITETGVTLADIAPSDDAEEFGRSLFSGDFNGDGVTDLAHCGQKDEAPPYQGRLEIALGPLPTTGHHAWDTLIDARYTTYALGAFTCVAYGAFDLDADGRDDILVGAPGDEDTSGSIFVLRGKATFPTWTVGAPALSLDTYADVKIVGTETWEALGVSIDHVGDVDGDGDEDLALGAVRGQDQPGVSNPMWAPGAVFIVPTSALFEGTDLLEIRDIATRIYAGPANGDGAFGGTHVGDVNGDGRPDLAVGRPFDDGVGENPIAFIQFGWDTP